LAARTGARTRLGEETAKSEMGKRNQQIEPRSTRARLARVTSERGVALVEFALVAPVFMLMLLAMIDMGKAFNYWIDNTHLANAGARLAVVNFQPPGGISLQEYVRRTADTGELRSGGTTSIPGGGGSGVSICVSYPGTGRAVGQPVRFTVTATYHWIPLVGGNIGALSTKIRGTAEMRAEQTPSAVAANDINSPC
jgi:hypothetical protein